MDDKEESTVIRKLSSKSNTDCSQTVDSPDKPSDGVTDIEGVQGDQVSQGGSIQEMGDDIDNRGNMSNYQHNQSSPSMQSIDLDPFQQHWLSTPSPRSIFPSQNNNSLPCDPQSKSHFLQLLTSGPDATPA
jgi:hypothetical protein